MKILKKLKQFQKNQLKIKKILNLNEKDEDGLYPFLMGISKNNIEIVQLLLEYALQHQIILEYEKRNIGNKPEIKNLMKKKKGKR